MKTRTWLIWRVALPLVLLGTGLAVWVWGLDWWQARQQRAWFVSCNKAQRSRQWDELRRLSEAWSRSQPASADAWLFRADAAQQLGDFRGAAQCLSAVPDSDPKQLPALVALSTLQFGPLHQPLDGVQTCERILKLEPRAAAAHQGLIEFYAMTMQRPLMIRQIRLAIEQSREPPAAYVYLFLADSMRLKDGIEMNATWLKTYPDTELFLVAEALQLPEPASGTTPSAIDKHQRIDELFERFPGNLELLAYEVEMAVRKGDVQALIALLKRVPATAEDDDRFWRAKGWLHLNRNEIPKARTALSQALELFPLDWNARSWLSDVARREGRLDEANRLQKMVQTARRLRERITAEQDLQNISRTILVDLAKYAKECGDQQLSAALSRRLQIQLK